jgi:N-acetylneuraminate synthase
MDQRNVRLAGLIRRAFVIDPDAHGDREAVEWRRLYEAFGAQQPGSLTPDPDRWAQLDIQPKEQNESRVLAVAEFTNNHLGGKDRVRRTVHLAAKAGADLVKVQKRDVDSFYTTEQLSSPYESPFGSTLGDYRRAVELDVEGFEILDEECRRCGIDWFCSVLDWPSYQFIARFGRRLLKLPSTISERRDLHHRVAREYTGNVVISTGFTTGEYEQFVLNAFAGNERIYLLQTNSAYPTPPFECSIGLFAITAT